LSSTNFDCRETLLAGCYIVQPQAVEDARGRFIKVFHAETFAAIGLPTEFPEVFYSVSQRNVVRGLHFQTPPAEQGKLVHCTAGRILDAVIDLRVGSPTQGRHILLELDAETAHLLYIPPGIAHGFRTLSDSATVVYHATHAHVPACDHGILWNSAGIDWGITDPLLSERDRLHPRFADFASPFRYGVLD